MRTIFIALFCGFSVFSDAQDKIIMLLKTTEECKITEFDVFHITATHLRAKKNTDDYFTIAHNGLVVEAYPEGATPYIVDVNILNRVYDIQYAITITKNGEQVWYCGGMMDTKFTNFADNIDVITTLSLPQVCKSSGDDTIDLEIPLDYRNEIIETIRAYEVAMSSEIN
jgi:hypothetical protein